MAIKKIFKRIYHLLPPGRVQSGQGQGEAQGEMCLDDEGVEGNELLDGGSFLLSG